jgi:2-oxoisovalerate dehydrogenase E1 component
MTVAEWRFVARTILASRLIDTFEETELAPKGKVLYQFSARGHELAQAILVSQMTHPHDAATVYYRSRPFVLGAGMTAEEAFAGPLAKYGSRNGGRDIGVVHNLPPRKGVTVLPASGDVGAQYTPAVGWAQAITYRADVMGEADWNGACAVAMGGDASCATNGFWAALTIATTQNYPMIFFIEDNNFGISVRGDFQTPGGNIAKNLANFTNLLVLDGDGADPSEAAQLIGQAVAHVRKRISPVLLRLSVPRICGHSGADSQSYKSPEERSAETARDPLPRLKAYLAKRKILSAAQWAELEQDIAREVRTAAEAALAQPEPPTENIGEFLFASSGKPQKAGGMIAEGIAPEAGNSTPETGARMNLIDAVRRTLGTELSANNRVVVFGEDVGAKGGVHGATIDLQITFGEARVFDTSLSEEGIIGRSVGMAFAGLVPVPEIQFRKYLDPAMEQINDCGTTRWRTNNEFAAPFVLRIPVGHSKRTGDPWHSVSGEAIFAHTLGWRVVMPSNAADAVGLLRTALRANDPVFFLEHRNLLDTSAGRAAYPGDNYTIPFGQAAVIREGTRATIVTWGEMVHRAKEAAAEFGNAIEILDLRTLCPWDKDAVLRSVRKTNRCLIAHEDGMTCGFGAEIAATLAKECFPYLDAPIERIAVPDIPIPYNLKQMDAVVPTVQSIISTLRTLLQF